MELYHITKVENKEKIIEQGLKPCVGKIFLFDDIDVEYPEGLYRFDKWSYNMRLIPLSDIIAKCEIGIKKYSLFRVNVDQEVYLDENCGESLVKAHQYYVEEPISHKDVEYLGDFDIGEFFNYKKLDKKYKVPDGCTIKKLELGDINLGYCIVCE